MECSLKVIDKLFSVCQVEDYSQICFDKEYVFIQKTSEENSLVMITDELPSNIIKQEDGFKCFYIEGVLDFSLIGILSKIAGILADASISIFCISTYNTDYVFIKEEKFELALQLLAKQGYSIKF